MGGTVAEKLVGDGHAVIRVTPAPVVSSWREKSLEQELIQSKPVRIEVQIATGYNLTMIETGGVQVEGVYGEGSRSIDCSLVVMATSRFRTMRSTMHS